MAGVDVNIQEIKTSLTAIEQAVNVMIATNAAIVVERDALLAERAGVIAELVAARDSLSARITALGG